MMKKIGIALAIFALLTGFSLGFAVFSETGLKLVVRAGEQLSGGRLKIGQVDGRLVDRFSIKAMHYVDPDLSVKADYIEFSWNPGALLRGHLHIYSGNVRELHIVSLAEEPAAATTSASLIPPDFKLPFDFSIDAFRLENCTFSTSKETVAMFQRLEVETSGSANQLKINTLKVVSNLYDLELRGTLGIADDWPINVTGSWKFKPAELPELMGRGQVTGSLAEGRAKVELNSPYSAQLTGQFSLDEGISWQAELQASGLDPSIMWPTLSGNLDIEALLRGEYRGDSFRADLKIAALEGELQGIPMHLSGEAIYDGKDVEIISMQLKSDDARLNIQGEIGNTFSLEYDLYVPDTDKFLPEFGGKLQGEGNLSGDIGRAVLTANLAGQAFRWQDFSVDSLHTTIEAELAANGEIKATGVAENIYRETLAVDKVKVDFAGNLIDHRVNLKVLTDNQSLQLGASGGWSAERWQGHIVELKATHPDKGQLQLDRETPLILGAEILQIDNLCLSDKDASLCFTGKLKQNQWQGDLEIAKIDPAIFFQQWPGALNTRITGNGVLVEDGSTYVVDVEQLSGELRSLAVEGGGRIEQSAGKLNFTSIEVLYGKARVSLNGHLGDDVNLKFVLDIPDMSELVPQVQATLASSGEITGDRRTPALDLNISAQNAQVGEYTMGTLQGDIVADLRSHGDIAVNIQANNLILGKTEFETVAIEVQGAAAEHDFALKAIAEPGNILIDGKGRYDTQWTGTLSRVDVGSENYGEWHLQESTVVTISAESSKLENLCLQNEKSSLCFQGAFAQTDGWLVEVGARSLPLQLLYDFGFIDIPLQGELEGEIQAVGRSQTISEFSAQATIPLLEIKQRSRDDMQYQLQDVNATATFAGEALALQLSSRLMQDGEFQGNIRIEPFNGNFQEITAQPLAAEFTANIDDLSFVSILTDGRLESTGDLAGDVKFRGTLTKPEAQGEVVLKNGGLAIADLGIELDDLDLQFGSLADKFEYTLSARSGPGELQGSGNFSFTNDQGLQVQSRIVGDSFELMNTNEYVFWVSPDLNLTYSAKTTKLRGNLALPHARIVVNTNKNAIRPSKDIIIVDDTEQEEISNDQLYMDVQVTLGKDVLVDAYGLQSDLQGSFRLLDEPGRNLSATGDLSVTEGTFSFYSVSLDITRGKLLFSGGNIENPGVDARAQRTVDGNTVGVDITGTAQDLQFELFSEPYLEESDILSYILVGRPMRGSGDDSSLFTTAAVALGLRGANTITNRLGEYLPIDEIYLDKGEGETDFSVVVGKNVTENLFIGYDQSLLNGSGEVTARYKLGRNFSVETKNSVNSTSGDIIYTIER